MALEYPRDGDLPKFLGVLKSSSSKWVRRKGGRYSDFHWQRGYGAFSVGVSQKEDLVRYIEHQEEHHKKVGFQEEFRAILKRYEGR